MFLIPHFALCIKFSTFLRLFSCHLTCRIPQPDSRRTTSLVTVRCRHLRNLELEYSSIHLDLQFPCPHLLLPPGAFPRALLHRCHIVYWTSVSRKTQLKLLRNAGDVCVRQLIFEKAESPSRDFEVVIPEFVLSIKSPTDLKLIGCRLKCDVEFGVPLMSRNIAIGCKHLKILHIENSFITPFALELILANCFVLETLFLADPLGLRDARISSRSLKHLQLILRGSIDVDAPQLKILSLQERDKPHERYDLKIRAPQTQEVLFDFRNPSQTSLSPMGIKGFLRTAQDLTSMKFSGAALQILAAGCWEDELDFSFKGLASLSLSLNILQRSQTHFLVKLLEACPSLSRLDLKVVRGQGESDIEAFPEHMFDRLKKLNCLSRHLKELNLRMPFRVQYEIAARQVLPGGSEGLEKDKIAFAEVLC